MLVIVLNGGFQRSFYIVWQLFGLPHDGALEIAVVAQDPQDHHRRYKLYVHHSEHLHVVFTQTLVIPSLHMDNFKKLAISESL